MFEHLLSRSKNKSRSFVESTPNQLMVRRFIDSIDENVLEDIFKEMAIKSGKSAEDLQFIPLSEIKIIDDENLDIEGLYTSSQRDIQLNGAWLSGHPITTLHTLIHEELHAVSDNSYTEKKFGKQSKTVTNNQRIGVSRYTSADTVSREFSGSQTVEDRYTVANEGITELVSEYILSQYLARTGDYDMYGRKEIAISQQIANFEHSYSKYRRAVRMFTTIVATLADIPEEIVTKTIIREYFQSGQILPMEIVDELEKREQGLSAKINDILNCADPETGWKQISLDIDASPAFSNEEKIKILSGAMTLLEEEFKYVNYPVPRAQGVRA